MGIEIYDILMILVIILATAFGAWKGLAWQIASLASMVLSYFVALQFRDALAPHINAEAPWNKFLAMLILFAATSLIIWIIFRMVASFIDRLRLKEFDHQLGAVLGLAKGILICVVITFFAVTLSEDTRGYVLDSKSGTYIATLIDKADGVMPEEIHDVLGPHLHKLEHELDHDADENSDDDDYHGEKEADNSPKNSAAVEIKNPIIDPINNSSE